MCLIYPRTLGGLRGHSKGCTDTRREHLVGPRMDTLRGHPAGRADTRQVSRAFFFLLESLSPLLGPCDLKDS